jgi:hypothetical protein
MLRMKRPSLPKKATAVDLRVPKAPGLFGTAPASVRNVPAASVATAKSVERYLSLPAIHALLGSLVDGYIGSLKVSLLYFQLEAFLRGTASSFGPAVASIPRRLLEHNRTERNRILCEMAPIDADLCFYYDAATKKTDMQWKAYFEHPHLARLEHERRVVLHIQVTESSGLKRVISAPLQVLMEGYGDVTEGHQGYSHGLVFCDSEGGFIDEQFYIGITSRNWLVRMEEHFAEIRRGSNKRFHAAWRAYTGDANVLLSSELVVVNQTFEGIMVWEEEQVDQFMAAGTSLNMIPGGFKGLRFLHEHRLTDRVEITLEERDRAIAEFVRRGGDGGGRAGVPNLLLAELWRDEDFYLKVLGGRSDVLSPAQVLTIRDLSAKGRTAQQIFEVVGARNVEQVRRVLDGKTYRRVRGELPPPSI